MMDSLHTILQYAESLEMPEGDYLLIANALRDAFRKKPDNETVWITYPLPENYLTVTLRQPRIETGCKEMIITYKDVRLSNVGQPGPSHIRSTTQIEFRYENKPSVIKERTHSEHEASEFDTARDLFEPDHVIIEHDGNTYEYHYESLLRSLKREVERNQQINQLEEDDDSIYWDECNFYTYVFGRINKILRHYFWAKHRQIRN
jgi:hemin uptake protein HemP